MFSIQRSTGGGRSPLDEFFLSFKGFQYDSSLHPSKSWKSLKFFKGWMGKDAKGKEEGRKSRKGKRSDKKESREENDARLRYMRALEDDVRAWFGEADDIESCHAVCRALGIKDLPSTPKGCASKLRNTHVNIVDLLQWVRQGQKDKVKIFKSYDSLRRYTVDSEKFFPQSSVEEEGETNIVLRHLLRRFFR
ncbi:hypothetical protein DL764_009950 [Monosporascus ibericus]|uniref:Uncharacterized protein n=1 Tax=Monosporascus ibericus TaxID=155417 RepID=A0A4V1X8U3_9PEZI|nr:hypothetical protein DL764_009950 [Monosporascus ibericus]